MWQVAELISDSRGQLVVLPPDIRFEGKEVFIRRDPETGDVMLTGKPDIWAGFFSLLEQGKVDEDFLSARERNQGSHDRDPFDGWNE